MTRTAIALAKAAARAEGYARREAQPDKAAASAMLHTRLLELEDVRRARTVLWYLHIGAEVRTQQIVERSLAGPQRIVIPYCEGAALRLWHLQHFAQLAPGRWNILEPREQLRMSSDGHVPASEIDVVIVPGVAFTCRGERLGNGGGYYDRFLPRTAARRIAVGFDCQLCAELPIDQHDLPMDVVVTQSRVIKTNRRAVS